MVLNKNFNDIITIQCVNCGAEVVIDTSVSTHARCHWCRSVLSINNRIENGSVPDAILPFSIRREDAMLEIDKFVKERSFFALPIFKEEFKIENVLGVYFPYMLIDAKAKCEYRGFGEHQTARYTVGKNNYRYDADLYSVYRSFDIAIDDLSIESSKNRLSKKNNETNNIINSIMPFDTNNCVKFESNYLIGFTSEKRDMNISNLKEKAELEIKDIARISINDTLRNYDRGVNWQIENVEIEGSQWMAAYLPVWLYSYHEKKKNVLHYIAVNGRTKEIMGSVPINMPKLWFFTLLIEFLAIAIVLYLCVTNNYEERVVAFLIIVSLFTGIIFHGSVKSKYRNAKARHKYEFETRKIITNLVGNDVFVEKRKCIKNSKIEGYNNDLIFGEYYKIPDDKK